MIIILHHQIKTLITGLFFGVDGIKSKSFMTKDFTNLTNFFLIGYEKLSCYIIYGYDDHGPQYLLGGYGID
jgi:hypothetical protein